MMLGTHYINITVTRCAREVVSEVVSAIVSDGVCALTSMPWSPDHGPHTAPQAKFSSGAAPLDPAQKTGFAMTLLEGRARENQARNPGHHSAVGDHTTSLRWREI